ncbi:hypothetical protein CEXT_559411 [Caerostris extrusa]|uniref:Uncharacterized protein n=1 Tax=Caerostris extrusa TaxID=172846 RepID=A0AAV4SAK6_CAEEX|nr:hypothetical protein CEXT_559411 [Caerostris extrusa]
MNKGVKTMEDKFNDHHGEREDNLEKFMERDFDGPDLEKVEEAFCARIGSQNGQFRQKQFHCLSCECKSLCGVGQLRHVKISLLPY